VTQHLPRRNAFWTGVLIAAYVIGVLPSLGQSLLETHAHRQTQTAYTAVLYAERGIDLLRPPLPVLGPPGIIPQEFPLFQAVAALFMRGGLPADMSVRVVGLASFVATGVLLFLLARRLMGSTGAFFSLGAFLFNAHAWLYGRTSLIEYLATAGGIGFLYFASRWMDEGKAANWAAAAIAGTVGILVKITTGGFLLLPAVFWRSRDGRWGFQRPSVLALVGMAIATGGVWSAYAEGVREETPASLFLSMENQWGWFFGSVAQRFDVGSWRVPLLAFLALTGFGIALWAPLAVARARQSGQSAFLLSLLALVVAVPLLLFNLYAIHDYYYAAVAPLIALGIGLGVEWLIANRRRRWVRRAIVGLAGAWVATIIGMTHSWSLIYGTPVEEARAMSIASFIRDHSDKDDWVVLRGWGWNSTFLYYARRQGLAVPMADPNLEASEFEQQDISEIDFDAILADPVFGPFISCNLEARCELEESP
jgi:Dolichyl-phosphate-mannose-protein mannosyltransferase